MIGHAVYNPIHKPEEIWTLIGRPKNQRSQTQKSWEQGNFVDHSATHHHAKIDKQRLAKILGMLGSNQFKEVIIAAETAERERLKAGLTWDQILEV